MTTRFATRVTATALCLQTALGSASPSWAQRRRAEPEANPEFQQQLQASPGGEGGAPLGAPEAPAAEAPAAVAEEPAADPRGVQAVQIGAAPQARPSATASVSLLDVRVTVRVKGAPLATFLDTISAQAKVNFIITEGLEAKRVTAFLQNVTVREALQVLLEIKGLTYQQIGKSNTYVVTPRSKTVENLLTRIYTLSYIPLIAIGSAASEQASITPAGSGGGGAIAGPGSGQGTPVQGGQAAQALAPGGGGDIAILTVLRSVLSKSGQIALEPRTNSMVITDIPEVFPQVEQIIAELDRKAPQVMIEAQIVEIDSTRSKDLGLEWGGARGEIASFAGGLRDTSFPQQLPRDLTRLRFLDPVVNVISGAQTGQGAGGGGAQAQVAATTLLGSTLKSSILDLTQLKVTLRALVARSEARFLGKPKILTLNNKAAVIQIASNQALAINQSVSGSSGLTQAATSAERVQTGLILKVTPQVNKEGYITMLVQPSFTDVQESSISTAANKVFDPISRGASTLVRVKNGQTLVMGGLLQSTETKVVRKVPFFGYIPLIGWLFTSISTRRQNSDLVIFITPTVVSD